MSNYSKSTNFATKDNLTPGDPLKIVRGTEIDTEFNNIATAIATKTDNASAAIAGGTINNTTIGATTASTGAFTTLAASGAVTLSGGTANGVPYLNGSKVVTSGSAFTFDGANIIVNATTPAYFTGTSNLAQVSINRSPSTGAIFNASQSAAYLNIDGASGGSSFQFATASAANTQPSERMRLDSSGNLGLGVTPSAWASGVTGFQLGNLASISNNGVSAYFGRNTYNASTGYKYLTTSTAQLFGPESNGGFAWYQAASGTAGNAITWTQAMTLDASGQLAIGTTSIDEILRVNGSSNATSRIRIQNQGTSIAYLGSALGISGAGNANDLMLSTGGATNLVFGINTSEKARIDSSGNFYVAKTVLDSATTGCILRANGEAIFTGSSVEPLTINRNTSDGTLVSLRQDNTEEGTISVSGTTVSYNGGHLSRWAQTSTAKDDSLVKGTVLSNLDAMNVYTDAEGNPVDNEQLNKVKISDVEGDANVAGVFVNWTHDDAHNVDEINMAMTGDMIIRIAQGTTVVRGDLLMSAGDGTAKPQGDDIVRSKTIAKVTSNHVTCTYADGSYCVPCVLMAC